MKVYWLSKHKPLKSQLRELNRLFDSAEVVYDENPFDDIRKIIKRFTESGAVDMVAIVPLSVLVRLNEEGIKPLIPRMRRCTEQEAEIRKGGVFYRFVRFARLKDIRVEVEDLCVR